MKYQISCFSNWDEVIFESFIELKKNLQGHLPTYFPESIDDYKKILSPQSPFASDYEWVGVQVHQDDKLLAKAILSWRKDSSIGNLGFIDWINDEEVAKLLMGKVEELAGSKNLSEIKTPVDLNFFVKYRIKCKGGGEPYYGEPIYPDYYHDLFVACGLDVIGNWDTYLIKRFSTFISFVNKRKKQKQKLKTNVQTKSDKAVHDSDVTIRLIRVGQWETELKIVYDLFVKSFSQMPEFEPISYDQFKLIYDDFKYLIHPLLSYIVEYKGTPVGFSINYPDPLAILSKVKGKKLSAFQKGLLLTKLKLNRKTLLMPYMGKTTGPNGEDIKGVFLKITKLLTCGVAVANKSLVCYQSPDSPSRRPIDPSLVQEYAKYVLYGKKLK